MMFPHPKILRWFVCSVVVVVVIVLCCVVWSLLLFHNTFEVTTISQPNGKLEVVQATIQTDCHVSIPAYFSQSGANMLSHTLDI